MKCKISVPTAQTFTRAMSSSTFAGLKTDLPKGLFASIKNKIQTKSVLDTIATTFVDFNQERFVLETIDSYLKLSLSIKQKDNAELLRSCSSPVYEFMAKAIKDKSKLPFRLHPQIENCKIINARKISPDVENPSSLRTWYQISMMLRALDENSHSVGQRVIVERREVDTTISTWRFAFIE